MDDEDKGLAAKHKELWDAKDFAACSDVMRQFRAKYPEGARQEGDGTVALYDAPDERVNINSQKRERFDAVKGWFEVPAT